MMELFPQTVGGVVQYRIFTFTKPNAENPVSSGGKASRPGDTLDSGSPAAIQIAESIVHEMNNHLSGIIGFVSVEIEKTGGEEEKGYTRILESAEKLSTLCLDLQSLLAGEEESALRDVVEEINLISEVMRRLLPENVTFRITGRCEKLVAVKREHLRELLYNLSLNSTGMMNGEGRIRIDVSEKIPSGSSHIESVSPGNRVCIRYSDGYIMPVALRDVLSGRKYSVSDVERQFGITIGALYKALREIDGKIVFERGSGETVLCIVLEGYEKPWSNDIKPSGQSVHSDVTGLSVLVADEVEIVLLSTCEYLEHRGMVTTAVSDGDSAMKLLRTKKFDAVVLDLNMPGIPTASIVRYCHTTLPSMAVVVTTGYGDSDSVRDMMKVPSADCLYKPHRPEMLVESIYSTLMRIQEGEHR
jgi:CheY-like chemotaxis protein